ncbi:F-box only protein 6 isoform X1 [Prunus yedoensis var. nudiflora]|uniref:F-box only protein 6 isoform X1 n=1 Tax=Prunus yedoensis var. nudiflora TaxID=2094558 RepID=A0A314YPV4_PRUYE|nr:F-box only protein 6 isoform X1 [Prunus yedoensis var. nudiflora]
MEGLAMLRQLIGQLQELVEVYGSHPHYHLQQHHHLHLQPSLQFQLPLLNHHSQQQHQQRQHPRWCPINVDEGSPDDYYSFMMAAGKSGSLKMLEPCKPPPTKRSRKERTRGISSGTTNTTEPMEQHIWKDFPEDLYEAVIARLPIATFFRFRTVCRKWNSLLDSESFSQHCAEVPQATPWFYTITHENVNSGAMYDPSLKKWHHPTISSLPTKLIVLPVASAGGLSCQPGQSRSGLVLLWG